MGDDEAPPLLQLNLSDCRWLTDSAVDFISTHLVNIMDLCLYGCLQLTGTAVVHLAASRINLQRVNVTGAYKITDRSMHGLFTSKPILSYVSKDDFGKPLTESQVERIRDVRGKDFIKAMQTL